MSLNKEEYLKWQNKLPILLTYYGVMEVEWETTLAHIEHILIAVFLVVLPGLDITCVLDIPCTEVIKPCDNPFLYQVLTHFIKKDVLKDEKLPHILDDVSNLIRTFRLQGKHEIVINPENLLEHAQMQINNFNITENLFFKKY